jgi:hypothetical protein
MDRTIAISLIAGMIYSQKSSTRLRSTGTDVGQYSDARKEIDDAVKIASALMESAANKK